MTNGVVMVEEKPPSFVDEGIDLKQLAKKLSGVSGRAVNVLVSILSEENASAEMKMRAATKLLEFHVEVAKAISTDQMQRLIAELKLIRNPQKNLVPSDEDGDEVPKPVVDFTKIRQVQ